MESINQKYNIKIARRDYHYGRDSPFRFFSQREQEKIERKRGEDGNWSSLFMNKTWSVMIISYGWIFWKINKTLGLKISSYYGIC